MTGDVSARARHRLERTAAASEGDFMGFPSISINFQRFSIDFCGFRWISMAFGSFGRFRDLVRQERCLEERLGEPFCLRRLRR